MGKDYSDLYKAGLSPAQIVAIAHVGEAKSVFIGYNTLLHIGTMNSLLRKNILVKTEDGNRVELTESGRKHYETYLKIVNPPIN